MGESWQPNLCVELCCLVEAGSLNAKAQQLCCITHVGVANSFSDHGFMQSSWQITAVLVSTL